MTSQSHKRLATDKGTDQGFTLVELLVVIAIIALLLAILLPSLKKAKDAAKRVVCSLNMKQMSNALSFYLSDFDNNQPLDTLGYWVPGLWQAEYAYIVTMSPYLGLNDVLSVAPSAANSSQDGRFAKYCEAVFPGGEKWNPKGAQFCPGEVRTPNVGWYGNPKFFDPLTSYGTIHTNWTPGTTNTASGGNFNASGAYIGDPKTGPWQSRALSSSKRAPASMGTFGHSTVDKGPYLSLYAPHLNPASPAAKSARYNFDYGNNHEGVLPFAFFDGHVSFITNTEIDDDRYSSTGDTPLWMWLW